MNMSQLFREFQDLNAAAGERASRTLLEGRRWNFALIRRIYLRKIISMGSMLSSKQRDRPPATCPKNLGRFYTAFLEGRQIGIFKRSS